MPWKHKTEVLGNFPGTMLGAGDIMIKNVAPVLNQLTDLEGGGQIAHTQKSQHSVVTTVIKVYTEECSL